MAPGKNCVPATLQFLSSEVFALLADDLSIFGELHASENSNLYARNHPEDASRAESREGTSSFPAMRGAAHENCRFM